MEDGIDWNLLAKYLSGEGTEEEEAEVRAWAAKDSTRADFLRELRQVWHMTDVPDPSTERGWDVERMWRRVEEKTQQESVPKSKSTDSSPEALPTRPSSGEREDRASRRRTASSKRSSRSLARRSTLRRVAVAAVLSTAVVLVALWGFDPFGGQSKAVETQTFVTEKGQRAKIRLNDGSQVHLNVDSRLVVAEAFGPGSRKVRLEGEAFFEVVKDSTRPFIVRTAESTTHVLGTSFDVSAYPEDEETRVVVKEGRVALSSADSSSGGDPSSTDEKTSAGERPAVVLGQGQSARLLRGSTKIVSDSSGLASHLAWMEGRLVFEDATFPQAVRKLERWYGLTITLKDADSDTPAGHLNAQFDEDQGLKEVLSVVATAFELEVERSDSGRVIFTFPTRSNRPQYGP